MRDSISPKGVVAITLRHADGGEEKQVVNNLVVQAGLNYLASAILASQSPAFGYMAVGTSGTAPTLGDTALGGELTRIVFSSSSTANGVVSISTVYGPGVGTGTISEAGIFNAAAAGTMLARATFSPYAKGALDTITINWTITV
jgi:hypothetical protein